MKPIELFTLPSISFFFIIHKFAFCCSPVNKQRLGNNSFRGEYPLAGKQILVDWYWVLTNPRKLIALIQDYHMVQRQYIYIFLLQILILTHLFIKTSYYASRENDEGSIYYPCLAGTFKSMRLFNNLWLASVSFNWLLRLHIAYKLIKDTMLNSIEYRHFSVTQLNYASMIWMTQMNYRNWFDFAKDSSKHLKQLKINSLVRANHLEVLRNKLITKLEELPHRSKMYHVNMIDFSECYLNKHVKQDKFSTPHSDFKNWYPIVPSFRLSLMAARNLTIANETCACNVVLGCLVAFSCFYYTDYCQLVRVSEQNLTSVFERLLTEPSHLIRAVEQFLFVILLIPYFYTVAFMAADMGITISRADRLIELLIADLDEGHEYGSQYKSIVNKRIYNKKIRIHLFMVKVNHDEFRDVRNYHTLNLNLMLVSNWLGSSYALSLFHQLDNYIEFCLLFISFNAFLLPTLGIVLLSTDIERKVSNIMIMINQNFFIKATNAQTLIFTLTTTITHSTSSRNYTRFF